MRSSLLVLCLLCACGGARVASADLQSGFTVASQRAQLAEAAVSDVQEQLAKVRATLQEQGLDRASGQQTMQQLQADFAGLRGSLEEILFAIKALKSDSEALRLDYERRILVAEVRIQQLETALGLSAPPGPEEEAGAGRAVAPGAASGASTAGGKAEPSAEPPVGFDARLALAEKRMVEGKQAVARAILEVALRDDPKNVRASEAAYRIAETWFNEGKWRDAAKKFQAVNDEWPKSTWAPWAMLRIGECFDGQGRPDNARSFYEGVVRTFPSSEAAKEAKKKLAR